MQVKRFRESTVRDALAAVRRDLGPDALVVSTAMVPRRGWRRLTGAREVEVTAAPPLRLSESRPNALPVAAVPVTPGHEVLVARLQAAGLDRALALEVTAAVPHRARRSASLAILRDALAGRLAPLAASMEQTAPIEVFVGPPGAGKTTTIAKLAAQGRAQGAARRGLIAADGYRVGAVEQLRLYSEILGTPFAIARTAQELEGALATCRPPVLIDTAGRSPNDRSVRDLYDAFAGRHGVRTHLVIAAGTSARDASRVLDRYEAARPDCVVITKVDEAESVAPLVHVVRERRLAVSYLGTGQRVPEDLAVATASVLAAMLLDDATTAPGEIA